MTTTIVWFRRDLRLHDNPALAAAAARGAVVPVFILDDRLKGWQPGGALRWWLHGTLASLDGELRKRGSRLILRRSDSQETLKALIAETGATALYWNRCYDPATRERDTELKTALKRDDIEAESFNASLLFEPWQIRTGANGPFKVFTPFWRACRAGTPPPTPQPAPRALPAPARWPKSELLDGWHLQPAQPDWAGDMRNVWKPGEAAARERLDDMLDAKLPAYPEARDRPGIDGTSRLSPYLAVGAIGPRQIWHAAMAAAHASAGGVGAGLEKFLSELGWREFCWHIAFHNRDLSQHNFRADFDAFPWRDDHDGVRAWQRGRTGYPIVDAGMRELWATGWMHNRVRMIVASFLIKHLLIDWRRGEDWFRDTLIDADFASNSANWQWVAGCGADAAPYFRIFNPVLQGEKFDADGTYVRRWVPEIAALPDAVIHRPWAASADILSAAGVALGRDYPSPIVDHAQARRRALDAFASLRKDA